MKKGIILALTFGFVFQLKAQNDTLFNKDFNDQDIVSGGWSNELVSGSENCFWDIFISANSAARVSNYSSGQNQACESWLISPSVNLTNTNPFLSFRSSYNFNGDPLVVLISTDYVSGDPTIASWTDITSMAILPSSDNFVWANSGLIDLSSYTTENVHVAFKYVGGDNDGKTWNLDDVVMVSSEDNNPEGWNCINNSCLESVLGMGDYATFEECQTACESIQNPITSIYEIQFTEDSEGLSPLEGQVVYTGGIVTAVKSDTTSFFIQNGSGPWNGIYVFDNNNLPQIGDSVTFRAEVDEFYSLTELKNVSDFSIVSSDNSIAFTDASPELASSESYEGVLVRLTDVLCNSDLNQYDEWSVSDGTNSVIVSDFLYTFSPVLNQSYNVIGLVDFSFDEFKVCPRNESDVTLSSVSNITSKEINSLGLYPNPSDGIVQIHDLGKFEVFSTSGQLVFSSKLNSTIINLKELSVGTYFCKLYDQNGLIKGMEKLIVF
jgi:hypothetical protein